MNIQEVELSLIADDTVDLLQLMLNIRTHKFSGYLALALSPLIGFVSEESHKYLSKQGLLTDDPILFKSFDLAITKLRALLKLFDDTDGRKEGLYKTLDTHICRSRRMCAINQNRGRDCAFICLESS